MPIHTVYFDHYVDPDFDLDACDCMCVIVRVFLLCLYAFVQYCLKSASNDHERLGSINWEWSILLNFACIFV